MMWSNRAPTHIADRWAQEGPRGNGNFAKGKVNSKGKGKGKRRNDRYGDAPQRFGFNQPLQPCPESGAGYFSMAHCQMQTPWSDSQPYRFQATPGFAPGSWQTHQEDYNQSWRQRDDQPQQRQRFQKNDSWQKGKSKQKEAGERQPYPSCLVRKEGGKDDCDDAASTQASLLDDKETDIASSSGGKDYTLPEVTQELMSRVWSTFKRKFALQFDIWKAMPRNAFGVGIPEDSPEADMDATLQSCLDMVDMDINLATKTLQHAQKQSDWNLDILCCSMAEAVVRILKMSGACDELKKLPQHILSSGRCIEAACSSCTASEMEEIKALLFAINLDDADAHLVRRALQIPESSESKTEEAPSTTAKPASDNAELRSHSFEGCSTHPQCKVTVRNTFIEFDDCTGCSGTASGLNRASSAPAL